MISEHATLVDVAFAVCTALDRAGIVAVLTGGSAATFYAPHAYQSDDVDFVITLRGNGEGHTVLEALGFKETSGYYLHSASRYPVEFPKGPLMIGDDYIESWATEQRGTEVLHVLSATDCCRDRLAAFLFWNDFAGLSQALAVAEAQRENIVFDEIRAWCARENQMKKYELFATRLNRTSDPVDQD